MNKVMWFDIPTNNIDQAAEFYGKLFDWQVLPRDPSDKGGPLSFRAALTAESDEQLSPKAPGAINGGIVTREIGISQPTMLIQVDDINQKIEEVTAAGGEVIRERTHLPLAGGYFAYVTDPEKNVIGLWEVED